MQLRYKLIMGMLVIGQWINAQTPVALNFDRNVLTSEILTRLQDDLTQRIDDQLKAAEGYVLDNALIREMLVPYKEYGINPDDGEYYKSIHAIYTSIKTDPDYDPGAELQGKIRTMLETRISNYAKSFIDEESQAIYTQLQGLFNDANKKITGLVELAERMYEIPPDDPEIETKWANELRKLGMTGDFVDKIGDMETMFGQAQANYAKPVEMITMIKDGLSTDDPTMKIEILFDFGEKFGEDLPVVGSLVSNLFKLGKEVLDAAKRAGGILERNLGQGCISADGEYVQQSERKQKFYKAFPHIHRACPLSQSVTAGVYQFIYANEDNASELVFYHRNDWLGSAEAIQDGTHAGEADIRALRVFLNGKGETGKAEDLAFLHQAYNKSPGFVHYKSKLFEKFNEIRQLTQRTYNSVSYCDDQVVEPFMMNTLDLNWLSRLMKDESRFDYGSVKIFTTQLVEDLVDQMLTNRYLSQHADNLIRLDDVIENLKNNVPVNVHGQVLNNNTRTPIADVRVVPDIPILFLGASCNKSTTGADGQFSIFLAVPEAYQGSLGFTATSNGKDETEELQVNVQQSRSYILNFFLEEDIRPVSELIIFPEEVTLKTGETATFTVTARYADGREIEVTGEALESATFTAEAVGRFRLLASFGGKAVSATVIVEAEEDVPDETTGPSSCDESTQRWNELLEKCECLPPLLENKDGDCVDAETLAEEEGEKDDCEVMALEFALFLEAARQMNEAYIENHRIFLMHHDRFYKEINDRAADVCENMMIAYTYYTALQAADRMKILEDEIVSLLIDIAYHVTVCPELEVDLTASGMSSDVSQWITFFDVSASVASMSDRVSEFGCNTDDMAQRGESVAPGELDPNFTGDGGTSTEIPGDGKDNDGDGQQDEIPVAGLPGYNITIALYDSGSAKDDVFNLSVEGRGSLGLTPAGGLRTYGLNLPAGTYRAEVLVVVAPDDIGTFTINILQHGVSIGSLTGDPGEGSVSTIVFTVTD